MTTLPIPGLDGYYATDDGKIIGRWGRPISPYRDRDGYLKVTVATERGKDSPRAHHMVHRLVCLAFHGPDPDPQRKEVRHKDGTRDNNVPANLEWGTRQENSDDRIRHGTVPRSESSGCAKLTNQQVNDIHCYLAMGFPQRTVAEWFGVSQSTIQAINTGKTWRKAS